jgi:hypothetical protein
MMAGTARAVVDPNTGVSAAVFDGDLDVFFTGRDEGLWQMSYLPSSGWHPAVEIPGGGVLTSAPAVDVFRGGNELDVFARGTNNALWQTYYRNGSGWLGHWSSLGGTLTSAPAVDVFRAGTEVDVFGRGTDNALWQDTFSSSWSGWHSLAGGLTSGPSADVFDSGAQVDTFVRGGDNGLWQRWYRSSTGWSAWGEIKGTNGELASTPSSVVSPNGTELHVFFVGTNGALWDTWFSNVTGTWSPPVQIPGTAGRVGSEPAAVSYQGNMYVFYLSSDAGLLQVSSHDGRVWTGPVAPAPPAPAPVTVTVPTPVPPPATVTTTIKPTARHGRRPRVKAALRIKWKWNAHGTRVMHVKTLEFPPKARITVSCSGQRCPVTMSAGWRDLGRLWHRLEHHWFHRRDKVVFKIAQRGHSAERAQFRIRHGASPVLKQS